MIRDVNTNEYSLIPELSEFLSTHFTNNNYLPIGLPNIQQCDIVLHLHAEGRVLSRVLRINYSREVIARKCCYFFFLKMHLIKQTTGMRATFSTSFFHTSHFVSLSFVQFLAVKFTK